MNGWIEAFVPLLAALKKAEPNNMIPTVWIGTQLVFAVGTALWLACRTRALKSDIAGMVRLVSQLDRDDLAKSYGPVAEQLESLVLIGPDWARFEQTVHREPLADGSVTLHRTLDAQDVFGEAIVSRHLNARFNSAVPGLLTSLGILGTFVGLTYGLAQVQGTFGDATELREGIQDLLKGASIAFSTSVWGILLSVTFSLFEKRRMKVVRLALNTAQDLVNATIPRRNSEAWLSEISDHSSQQTRELKRFNTDLAVSIAQALDEKLAARITPAMDKLVTSINELQEFKQESSVEAIQKLVSEFTSSLSEGSSKNIGELNDVLSGVNDTLTRTMATSEQSQRRLEDSLESHLNDLSGKVESVLGQLSESQRAVQEATGLGMEDMLRQINEAVSRQQLAFGEVTSAMKGGLEAQMQSITNAVENLVGNVGEQSRRHSDHTAARLKELADVIEATAGSSSSRFEQESQQLLDLAASLKVLLDRLEDAGEGMALAGEAMKETAVPVQQAVESLRVALASLQSTQGQLSQTVTEAESRTAEHLARVQDSAALIQDALLTARDSWTAYSDNFGGLREQLSGVFGDLTQSVADYSRTTSEGITQYLREFEGHLERATGSIGGALEGLQEVVDDMNQGRST